MDILQEVFFFVNIICFLAIIFVFVTLMAMIDNDITDIIVIIFGTSAVVCYVMWTVSVFELKMEYTFTPKFAIQGYIVAVDRTIINASFMVFLALIPPERFDGDKISGRQFTFLVGSVVIVSGALLALTVPNKRVYHRKMYEEEKHIVVSDLDNDNQEYPDRKSIELRKEALRKSMEAKGEGTEVIAIRAAEDL